ncbi:MAG: hypothetical protein Q9M09_03415 [Mariprofundaceae bacterium]|nr:hypothetical protein [Mariprofundaceae bacterium]
MMKIVYVSIMVYLACLPFSLHAAPLNKFGTIQQQMTVPQMQQTALPPPIQQQPIADIAPQAVEPVQAAPVVKKEKHTVILNKVEKLLSSLPLEKLKAWQGRFEDKRQAAKQAGKTNVMKYYNNLIVLCEKLKKDGGQP